MELTIEQAEMLLLTAATVAIVARRLHIPYTVGLVLAGGALAILRFTPSLQLTKDLVFTVFLPPLIFEAAWYIRWHEFRQDLSVILGLATLGVILSVAVTTVGMFWLAGWQWTSAVIFGILIAATDPVSVIATFKEAGIRGRLKMLVEGESLLNDSTAVVGFGIALSVAAGGQFDFWNVAGNLTLTVVGGILSGLLVAGGVLVLAGHTQDHLAELTLTTVAAYGSFWLAEQLHCSGVLATLAAGMLIGNVGVRQAISERGQEAVESFWEFAAFVANSLIFILIGIRVAQQNFSATLGPILIAIVLVTLGRAVAVYPGCFFFAPAERRVKASHQHILFWGGLRGALALALALGLPSEIPMREEIVTVTFAVVAFSVFVQGLTITPLLRRMGEIT